MSSRASGSYDAFVKTMTRRHLALQDFLWVAGVGALLAAISFLPLPVRNWHVFAAMAALFGAGFCAMVWRRSRNPFHRMERLLETGQAPAAAEEAREFLRDQPDDPGALAILLVCAFNAGDLAFAREIFRRIEARGDLPARARGAMEEWKKALG